MKRAAISVCLGALLAIALGSSACGTVERAAAKDPMKCERDPSCAAKSDNKDCATQCNYDPACTDRCREMIGDSMGHR